MVKNLIEAGTKPVVILLLLGFKEVGHNSDFNARNIKISYNLHDKLSAQNKKN